jgi:peptidoglycan/LPS O-acetylase OafA/YrhL
MDAAFPAVLASCVISTDHSFAGAFQNRPMRGIGAPSYGLYLLHMFCFGVARAALTKPGIAPMLPKFKLCRNLPGCWLESALVVD